MALSNCAQAVTDITCAEGETAAKELPESADLEYRSLGSTVRVVWMKDQRWKSDRDQHIL